MFLTWNIFCCREAKFVSRVAKLGNIYVRNNVSKFSQAFSYLQRQQQTWFPD